MARFQDLPLHRKLTRLMVETSVAALIIAIVGFLVFEIVHSKREILAEYTSLADVIVTNSTAALDFDDPSAASDVLDALHSEPSIFCAVLFHADGSPFASYFRDPRDAEEMTTIAKKHGEMRLMDYLYHKVRNIGSQGYDFDLHQVSLVRPVMVDGEIRGIFFLVADLDDLYASLKAYGIIVTVVLSVAFIVAYLLARKLQNAISKPIRNLVNTMAHVEQYRDYSIRVHKDGEDEIGMLIDRFNSMLDEIGAWERELADHRRHLEEEVAARTAELSQTNQELERHVDQLQRAKEGAEVAARAKANFLANMSHEIRTPMNGILGTLELLADGELSGEQRRYAEIAHTSAQALLTVLNDILDISKIEAGKLILEKVDFELCPLVEEVVSLLSGTSNAKGLELICVSSSELPQVLRGDPTRVRQIIANILGNAIKFTEKGSVAVRVKVERREKERVVIQFEVEDTGIGISERELQTLFDPFTQADASTTRRFGGTGLGLAICRQLVDMMGGKIWAESTPGKGSIFRFVLPFEISSPTSETNNDVASEEEDVPIPRSRILLVEDNRINQRVAVAVLDKLGMITEVAENGREAVEAVTRGNFDLVFMDCQMPVMDGYEATAAIRAEEARVENEHLPIIAMTANAMVGDRERCLAAGMDDYLSKPVKRERVESMLRRWLVATAETAG